MNIFKVFVLHDEDEITGLKMMTDSEWTEIKCDLQFKESI